MHISRTTGRIKFFDLSRWPQDLIYYGFSWTCIPLRQPEVPKNTFFCIFGAFQWLNFMIFHISWNAGRKKLVDSSEWTQEWIYYGYSKVCYSSGNRKCPKTPFFVFWTLYYEISKVSILWELYNIYNII